MIERIAPHRDALDVPEPPADHRPHQVTAEFPVRPLISYLGRNYKSSFENDLGGGRHFDIYHLAGDQLDGRFSESAGDRELIDINAGNELRSEKYGRIGAYNHRHFEFFSPRNSARL